MTVKETMPALRRRHARGLAVAMTLALASLPAAAVVRANATPATVAPDVVADPAGAWRDFLANAPFETAYPAYNVVAKLGYASAQDGVDADACRTSATALHDAVAAAPVSILLHRVAMLCAEAVGDDVGAERELKAVAALSKLAWASATESRNGSYVRVLRPDDIYAFIAASGLEFKYGYYEQRRPTYYFPLTVAVWDPERKVERHLRFDFVDATHQLAREEAYFPYPSHRTVVADAYLTTNAKWNDTASIDTLAWRAAWNADDFAGKVEKVREAAAAGGMQSARVWIGLCSRTDAPKGCADGLVDALLPFAEQKQALAMTLVAYAYEEGLGVKPDVAASDALLAAADARWSHHGASVEFAERWLDAHDGRLPASLRQRVEAALAAGNDNARQVLVEDKRAGKVAFDAADVAYLQSPGQNARGAGYAVLAGDARDHKHEADEKRWNQLAAQAGDPMSLAFRGSMLVSGLDVAKDRPAGLRALAQAAQGGNAWAARMMAYDAMTSGDFGNAERWVTDSASGDFDTDSLLLLAQLYLGGYPGVSEKPEKGVAITKALSDYGVPDAHRRMAQLHMFGTHVAKDPVEAKRLLMLDAKKGDHESEGGLGLGMLNGYLGPVDEREGLRWTELAMAGGDIATTDGYAYWLYFRKATAASRTKAMQVWQDAYARGKSSVNNNYAWVLCTTPDEAFRNAKLGAEVAAGMGDAQDLAPAVLDTVAACRAAVGDYAGALDLQKRAIAMADRQKAAEPSTVAATTPAKPQATSDAALAAGEPDVPGYRVRLALYADGKPFLDTQHKD